MKLFHLFIGAAYYPESGLGDYRGSFHSEDEAKDFAISDRGHWDWWTILGHAEDGSLITVAWGPQR
jgi:hypothetical protein